MTGVGYHVQQSERRLSYQGKCSWTWLAGGGVWFFTALLSRALSLSPSALSFCPLSTKSMQVPYYHTTPRICGEDSGFSVVFQQGTPLPAVPVQQAGRGDDNPVSGSSEPGLTPVSCRNLACLCPACPLPQTFFIR